jgi:acetyl esterase/lipase
MDGVRGVWLDRARSSAGVIVYLHGGTYITGPEKEQWQWFSRLCRSTAMAGLMVDYDLAPDAAYPVAHDQTIRVLDHLAGDSRWFLAGDSAGGGLALGVAYTLRDTGRGRAGGLLLVSPWLDITMSNPEARARHRIDAMLSLRGLSRGAVPYAGESDPRDPHISPLFGDPGGLPPMQVHVGTRELFLWDNRAWARKCREAGVACELIEVEGGFHDFAIAVRMVPEARAALAHQVRFLTHASSHPHGD